MTQDIPVPLDLKIVEEIIERMRRSVRWRHGSENVWIYADTVDAWADQLEAEVARLSAVRREPQDQNEKTMLRAWTASDYAVDWIYRADRTEMSGQWKTDGPIACLTFTPTRCSGHGLRHQAVTGRFAFWRSRLGWCGWFR